MHRVNACDEVISTNWADVHHWSCGREWGRFWLRRWKHSGSHRVSQSSSERDRCVGSALRHELSLANWSSAGGVVTLGKLSSGTAFNGFRTFLLLVPQFLSIWCQEVMMCWSRMVPPELLLDFSLLVSHEGWTSGLSITYLPPLGRIIVIFLQSFQSSLLSVQ